MRILILRSTQQISGAEKYNLYLLNELKRKKSLNISFVSNNKQLISAVRKLGIETHVFNFETKEVGTKKELLKAVFAAPHLFFDFFRIVRQIEKKEKIDIFLFESRTEKLFLTPVLKLFGKRVVWLEHGPFYVSETSIFVKYLFRILSSLTDKIISVSQDTKNDLISGRVDREKITVIYIGLDTSQFVPLKEEEIQKLRKHTGIDLNAIVVGYLGTVASEKGIKQFITIASSLLEKNRRLHFIVIGEGPKLEWAKSSVRVRGLSLNFTFTGFVENIDRFLGIVDILLFPTQHQEGISMALLEVQSMGLPIVSSDIGGNAEIITHGVNGFLYKRLDILSMKRAVIKLSKNKQLRVNIGKEARKNIEKKFNIQNQVKLFYEFFLGI